ncbi:hypothetical protein KR222_004536 [Zaprionus bogoriensis]|nr:hypothetical protein KR222_004536 [Zaprionus bogoriensis]
MDLQEFLSLERKQLEQDRQRLSAACSSLRSSAQAASPCPAALLMQTENFVPGQCQRMANGNGNGNGKGNGNGDQCNEPHNASTSALATANQNLELQLELELSEPEGQKETVLEERETATEASTSLIKSAKEFVNQRELLVGSARQYKSPNASLRQAERPQSENRLPIGRHKQADDMEQWVTDTFYSYFPGFNNENQKRQNYLRERQRENQQNFLKHQMLHPPAAKHRRQLKVSQPATTPTTSKPSQEELQTARSNQSSTSTSNSRTDKTDIELIVNSNPNYIAPKTRPGTTRHQLLQDLGHVELANIVTGDGIMERNLRSSELETARKKDYQRDLMLQIEEKRRSIEVLREKERRQEEALTRCARAAANFELLLNSQFFCRRLEAQLKTIQLEEQLEKQRQRAEKARMDSEHNRLMREQLLAKLEQDAQLLHANEHNNLAVSSRKDINGNASNHNNFSSSKSNSNKVYKYFSNSARHEYRRGEPLPEGVELDFELPELAKIERECFHLSEKICPLCDEPLKSYESCCLRCQRKLALKMKKPQSNSSEEGQAGGVDRPSDATDADGADHECQSSYALVCLKCERLYAMCRQCLAKSDICRACQRERNVCMNCRRNLCSFCLEEIACGRDAERTHVNEREEERQDLQQTDRTEDAFRVLELNFAVPSPAAETTDAAGSPPYSFNISPNSVFHGDYKPTPVKPLQVDQMPIASSSANNSFELDSADEQAMERVRRQTDKRLSRYLKNYGDLAAKHQQQEQQQLARSKSESRHCGTQTTPLSLRRRDVVLHEAPAQNLSMPLLREMPKMTRKETTETGQRKIDNLKKRWEVPAVQKFRVSTSSPKILTQVGAIRKQLQAARFFDDAPDRPDDADADADY